jgi:hypothetical protein
MLYFIVAFGISLALSSNRNKKLYDLKVAPLSIYLLFSIVTQIVILFQQNSDFHSSEFLLKILKELIYSRDHTFVLLGICWMQLKIIRDNHIASQIDFPIFTKFAFAYSMITNFELDHLSRIIFIIQLVILADFIQKIDNSGFKVDTFVFCCFESSILYFFYDSGFNNFMISANYYLLSPFINIFLLFVFQASNYDRNNRLIYLNSISNTVHQIIAMPLIYKRESKHKQIYDILSASFIIIFVFFLLSKYIYGLTSYIKLNIIYLLACPLAGCMCNYKMHETRDPYFKNMHSITFSLFIFSWLLGFISFND